MLNAPVALHPENIQSYYYRLLIAASTCAQLYPFDRWQTKNTTSLLLLIFLLIPSVYVVFILKYVLLQLLGSMINTKCNKWNIQIRSMCICVDRIFLFEFLYVRHVTEKRLSKWNEMIKGKKKTPSTVLLLRLIVNKGNHFKLGITCCVYYQPSFKHTYAATKRSLRDC